MQNLVPLVETAQLGAAADIDSFIALKFVAEYNFNTSREFNTTREFDDLAKNLIGLPGAET